VVGREDTDRLVKPKAFVVLKDGTPAAHGLEAELKDSVKGKLAADKYPRWIEFVAELPRRPRARSTAS
jgi:benzoate-CoA ligase